MQWFGQSWGAPICDPQDHAATPVGEHCGWCEEPITEEDSGVLIPHVGAPFRAHEYVTVPYHRECFIRQIAGSVAHQLRLCSCPGSGGSDHGELEEGMTRREAAKLAEKWFTVHLPNAIGPARQ